ncbi:hypothetical protein ACFB49_09360 [Sphingomonas sp. DBB INV C78]|uniref:hypothetical protein n=1 Tax=Sphingomonas sp. DBB INV C78 TaxID=3349434 RepID=UPI0036D298C6
MRKIVFLSAVLAVVSPMPGHAAPACWSREDTAAAKVRDLDILLTDLSQRCVAAGLVGAQAYEAYAAANRGAVSATNQRLKARFFTAYGPEQGRARLDSFLDAVAGQYARVPVVTENCGQVAMLAREATTSGGSVPALLAVADRNKLTPPLPGGVCPTGAVKVAAR